MVRFSLRSLRVGGLLAMMAFAGLTAAYAATGHFPLVPRHVSVARAFAVRAAGSLTIDNSLGGQALLNASAMAPGESRAGSVTITNSGNIAGDFTLLASALSDSGSATPFSSVAQLLIQDVTTASPLTIYAGTIAGLNPIALGSFAAAEARTYRFTVTFPNGTAVHDNPLQGAMTTVEYDWAATAADGSVPTPPATTIDTTAAPVLGESTTPSPIAPVKTVPKTVPVTVVPVPGLHGATKRFRARIYASRRRRVISGRVDFLVTCGRRCMVSFGGTIRIPPLRRRIKVSHVNFTVPAGVQMRVEVKISSAIKAGVLRALAAHKRPTITAQITARSGRLRARRHRAVRFVR